MSKRILKKELPLLIKFNDITEDNYISTFKKSKMNISLIKKIKELNNEYNFKIINVDFNIGFLIFDLKYPDKITNLKIKLNNYPFGLPSLFINSNKYSLCLINKHFKLNGECICCQSILCQNNWRPTFNIFDILSEYCLYNKKYFSVIRKKCKYYCNIIIGIKFGFYLPISEFI